MKEYTKGNILLNDLGGGFYLYRYDEYVENFTKQDLLDLHSLLSEILETPTVKEPISEGLHTHTLLSRKDGSYYCSACLDEAVITPPSNSEKEECCVCVEGGEGGMFPGCPCKCHQEEVKEDTKKDIRMLMSGYPPKEPVKKPLLAIFNGKIDVNESLRRIAKYLDQTK